MLWATHATPQETPAAVSTDLVAPVCRIGATGLAPLLAAINRPGVLLIDAQKWDMSRYRPVPSVIQAAVSIFVHHDVRAIAQAGAANLNIAAAKVVDLIRKAKENKIRALIFLTGVPGSGKTLAGLQAVHDAIATETEPQGDIVYLSGNTPLVTVLRESLARSEYARQGGEKGEKSLHELRRDVRVTIQHVNDFLKEALLNGVPQLPVDHAIVFDEAQRAWDEKQGLKKFNRKKSEPALLLEIMGLHADWCACVCLIGGGQEINSGERGVRGWGDAVRTLSPEEAKSWVIYGPPDVLSGGTSTAGDRIGELPPSVTKNLEPDLQLQVPLRAFRSPALNDWVDAVLSGDSSNASGMVSGLRYPIRLTRSLNAARSWLRGVTRGERRCGLVANSGARRLRADGLGEILHATDGMDIAHWYLEDREGDIRACSALEVPANEYTCQGLELDFIGVCWGGNFLRGPKAPRWLYRRLNGDHWQTIGNETRRQFIKNGYRVLLTRAREGLMIWVPIGDAKDKTREPGLLDATAEYLLSCGAVKHSGTDFGSETPAPG